jgi:hypothetical protein
MFRFGWLLAEFGTDLQLWKEDWRHRKPRGSTFVIGCGLGKNLLNRCATSSVPSQSPKWKSGSNER